MEINVQFADASEERIVGYFGCTQPKRAYPYLGSVDHSDSRWAAFFNSIPEGARLGLPEPDAN